MGTSINKRLRGRLRGDDSIEHFRSRSFTRIAIGMGRVLATHPFEAEVEQLLLDIGPAIQTVEESAGSPKTRRIEA